MHYYLLIMLIQGRLNGSLLIIKRDWVYTNITRKFQHDIMSIYIPKGLGLTVYDSENFEGKSHKYTTS